MIYEQLKQEHEQADPDQFIKKAKTLIMEQRDDNAQIYLVWFCKTLQNWKALLSTDIPDGLYYEVTYDGDKQQAYVDTYSKIGNVCVLDHKLVDDDKPVDIAGDLVYPTTITPIEI